MPRLLTTDAFLTRYGQRLLHQRRDSPQPASGLGGDRRGTEEASTLPLLRGPWRRWHKTLSTFLRDYLYIPLGGNRKGPRRRYVNRAQSLGAAHHIFAGMVGLSGFAWHPFSYSLGRKEYRLIVGALGVTLFFPNRQAIMQWEWISHRVYAIAFTLLVALPLLRFGDSAPFVYFQF